MGKEGETLTNLAVAPGRILETSGSLTFSSLVSVTASSFFFFEASSIVAEIKSRGLADWRLVTENDFAAESPKEPDEKALAPSREKEREKEKKKKKKEVSRFVF